MTLLRMADMDLSGMRVLIREDLHVPVQNGVVTSDMRIRAPGSGFNYRSNRSES
jgi:phosphoglycerate kinase